MGDRCDRKIVNNIFLHDLGGYLAEDDDNEGENEIDFHKMDTITEEDSSDESEQN